VNRYTVEFKSPGGKSKSCSVRAYSGSAAIAKAMEEHNDLRHYPDRITRVIKEQSNG
jgi:hypothetical protein